MFLALLGAGCASTDDASTTTNKPSADSELALNQIQVVGTHNSYHVQPIPKLFEAEKAAVAAIGPDAAALGDIDSLNYTHETLTEQLESGVRSFELDVYADPVGGLFANPLAPVLLNVPEAPKPEGMDEPGFKVLHINDIDYSSTCATFVTCLSEIKEWSDANSKHVPLSILVELKDDQLPAPIDATKVVPIDAGLLDELDAEIRSVFDEDEVITPDDVRGDAESLREAVTTSGWPSVDSVRGQVMFFMDNSGRYRDDYVADHPTLEGRVLFTSSAEEGDDDRAVVKVNEPEDGAAIAALVEQGYIVRTRADSDVVTVRSDADASAKRRDISFESGAQIISTDFPPAEAAENGYVVSFGDGPQVRCNPVNTEQCPSGALEP